MTPSESSELPPQQSPNSGKAVFRECLAIYRSSGAEPLRERLNELLTMAKSNPNQPNFRLFVSDLVMDLGRYEEGIELIKESLRLTGPCDILQNNLAYCYSMMGATDLAYKSHVESIRLNPTNRSSLRGACFLAIEGDRYEEALDYCARFHATAPTGVEETLWFAIALHNSGIPDNRARAEQLISDSDPKLNLRERFDSRE